MTNGDPQSSPQPLGPRWGLRTMGFLILAVVAQTTAMVQGHQTVGTLGSVLVGVVGGAICSVKGVRRARARGMYGLLMDRRRR